MTSSSVLCNSFSELGQETLGFDITVCLKMTVSGVVWVQVRAAYGSCRERSR